MLTIFLIVTPAAAQNVGSLQLNLGNQQIAGQLTNLNITNGTVSMTMTLNAQIQTQVGPIPMTATGIWVGSVNGTSVTGTIEGVTGNVEACVLFMCGSSDFIGQGQWTGTLNNGSKASGAFTATITFTSSSFSQVPLNKPEPVTGTWNANLQPSTN
ncbi:MAG TPA: hypothetical protein VJZ32_09410 [Candidatus Bathyarchaeia archaeon]|nr:hypothetical protein [Candidatus Bathyarchaeia archaeon]